MLRSVRRSRALWMMDRTPTMAPTPIATQMKKEHETMPGRADLAQRHAEHESNHRLMHLRASKTRRVRSAAGIVIPSPIVATELAWRTRCRAALGSSITHRQGHFRDVRQLLIVSHEDDRRATRPIDIQQNLDDMASVRAVKIAGRLVGQEDRRIVGQARGLWPRAAARHQTAETGSGGRDRPVRPHAAGSSAFGLARGSRGDLEWNENVFERAERRNEVEELKDEPDLRAAQARQAVLVQLRDVDPVQRGFLRSTARRGQRSSPSKRRLAAARRPDDRDTLA